MNLALLDGIGRRPINAALPAGSDVREAPQFDALQLEIGKLSNPGADGQTDWQRVSELASLLLAEKGKDLLVASYLNAALTNEHGLPGLAMGLEVMADLIEHFWDHMSPPVARLRARRNAIQWLLDRAELAAGEQQWNELPPQPPTLIAGLMAATRRIDAQLREKDEEAPSLRSLEALLDRVAVAQDPPAPAATQSAQAAPIAPPAATPVATPVVAPQAAPVAATGDVASALTLAFDHLNQLADVLMAADPCDARAYRISRFANWSGLEALAPATGGITQIGAPIAQLVDALQRMQQEAADPRDAIGLAEAQFPAFPLWLDLQALCADALARLGEAGAAARSEVERATRGLLERLPGLENLSFANGMPFANGRTLEWIGTLARSTGSAGAGAPLKSDGLGSAVAQARVLAASGELEAAVSLMQKRIDDTNDAPARLRAQIRLCELLSANREGRVPAPFAQRIVEQIRHHDLDLWDPALALEGWVAAYAVLSRDDARAAERDAALAAIARLDAARAIALT